MTRREGGHISEFVAASQESWPQRDTNTRDSHETKTQSTNKGITKFNPCDRSSRGPVSFEMSSVAHGPVTFPSHRVGISTITGTPSLLVPKTEHRVQLRSSPPISTQYHHHPHVAPTADYFIPWTHVRATFEGLESRVIRDRSQIHKESSKQGTVLGNHARSRWTCT